MNPKSIVLVACSLAAPAAAQLNQTWTTLVDGGGVASYDIYGDAVQSTNGHLVAVGYSRNFPAPSDPLITRFDTDGNVVWTRRPTQPGASAKLVAAVPGGSVVLCIGSSPAQLVKYDAAGSVVWTSALAGSAFVALNDRTLVDTSGKSYVCGGVAAVAPGDASSPRNMFLESHAVSGILRWTYAMDGGSGRDDEFTGLALAPFDNIVAVGRANADGEFSDSIITRFDSTGAVVWSRTRNVVPAGAYEFLDVEVDASGTSYALGFAAPTFESSHYEVVAYDDTGTLLWTRALGPTWQPDQFVLDLAGGPVLLQTKIGSDAVGVVKYASDGTIVWERTWSDPSYSNVSGHLVRVDPSGDVLVVVSGLASGAPPDSKRVSILRYDPSGALLSVTATSAQISVDDEIHDAVVDDLGAISIVGRRRQDGLVVHFEPQSTSTCIGDGARNACPCGNTSAVGAQSGCANSSGASAALRDLGIASLTGDTLRLRANGETPNAPTLLVQGSANSAAAAFGDGLRCVGGSVRRMGTSNASAGSVEYPASGAPSISRLSAMRGDVIAPGTTRTYQTWYRDPNPTFCTAPTGAAWNMSSALVVRWTF